MPTAGAAHQDEIPKPSAEALWVQELGEGLIYSVVTAVHSTAQHWPCAPLLCLAAAPWDTSCCGWGGFTLPDVILKYNFCQNCSILPWKKTLEYHERSVLSFQRLLAKTFKSSI